MYDKTSAVSWPGYDVSLVELSLVAAQDNKPWPARKRLRMAGRSFDQQTRDMEEVHLCESRYFPGALINFMAMRCQHLDE